MSEQERRYVVTITIQEDRFSATRVVEAQEYRPFDAIRLALADLEGDTAHITSKPVTVSVEETD